MRWNWKIHDCLYLYNITTGFYNSCEELAFRTAILSIIATGSVCNKMTTFWTLKIKSSTSHNNFFCANFLDFNFLSYNFQIPCVFPKFSNSLCFPCLELFFTISLFSLWSGNPAILYSKHILQSYNGKLWVNFASHTDLYISLFKCFLHILVKFCVYEAFTSC